MKNKGKIDLKKGAFDKKKKSNDKKDQKMAIGFFFPSFDPFYLIKNVI